MKKQLRNKEIRNLKEYLKEDYIKSTNKIEELKDNDDHFILVNSKVALFEFENNWICSLHTILENNNEKNYKEIIVDKGAIPFVIKGADIMRPGMTKIDESIEEKEIVIVKEETHNKIIAIGQAKLSGKEMSSSETGKVIKNLHYVSDDIWNFTN